MRWEGGRDGWEGGRDGREADLNGWCQDNDPSLKTEKVKQMSPMYYQHPPHWKATRNCTF